MRAWLRDSSWTAPAVVLSFGWDELHARNGLPLRDWIKTLPGRFWDESTRMWTVTETGPRPEKVFADAGFMVEGPDGRPADLRNLAGAVAVCGPDAESGLIEVYPRLAGPDVVREHVGGRVLWRQEQRCWLLPAHVLVRGGKPVGWCDVPGDVVAWVAANPERAIATLPDLPYDHTPAGLSFVPVNALAAVTPRSAEAMSAVGITSASDLLSTIPHRYIDMSNPGVVDDANVGQVCTVLGTVRRVELPQPGGPSVSKATIVDANGQRLFCRWFNVKRIDKRLPVGAQVIAHGTLEKFEFNGGDIGYSMKAPQAEAITDTSASVIGVYPASPVNDLTSWMVHDAAREACRRLGPIVDPVPEAFLLSRKLPSIVDAYRMVHDPANLGEAKLGRDRLAYDELLRLQVLIRMTRAAQRAQDATAHQVTGHLTDQLLSSVPYDLTGAQTRAVDAIRADMTADSPMDRLLHGEVGSGKTLVSLHAMLGAVEHGGQAALIAPNEVLAVQHFEDIRGTCAALTKADGTPVTVALLTGKAAGKKAVLAGLKDGSIDIVVGTHAVLAANVTFHDLTLAVIDEQHRFGVEQRAALKAKGQRTPDTLYATATPVPRTALMTVFGDLDISVLDELPAGRSPITTTVLTPDLADTMQPNAAPWAAVRKAVASGHQAFVVCPMVHTSQTREAAGAHSTRDELALGALAGLRIGVVTGKDALDDRRAVMADFAAGNLDVLVATTVIEVGVNVPNASVMVVLGGETFGLAQLHQLRGRVGRGTVPGTCFIVAVAKTPVAERRLAAIASSSDGFALADLDADIRKTGQLLGAKQSGTDRTLKVASVTKDTVLLGWASQDAADLVASDPDLAQHPELLAEITAAVGDEEASYLLSA